MASSNFVDYVKVCCRSGKGGAGSTHFHRDRTTAKGGPDGGNGVSRPADYDAGFKILRAWVDQNGGPPEEIRQKLRELWIDYDKAPQKTTRYSARKKGRHKI